jgi:hypothetical protein
MSSLKETLANLKVDDLKALLALLPEYSLVGRKDDLVQAVLGQLSESGLRGLWDRLDDYQKKAVSEAVHAPDLAYNGSRFRAKYGRLPDFSQSENGRGGRTVSRPSPLALFLHYQDGSYRIPDDVAIKLKGFVPTPPPVGMDTVDSLPETSGDEPLEQRACERDAMMDLAVLLRLVDQGRIKVSEKTALPGAATQNLLTEHLTGGDFYPWLPKEDEWQQEIGPIKAFAWPMLLQAGGLVQKNGSKLALSPAGLKGINAPPADTLRGIWRKWQKSTLLDEFSRINDIKGQKSAGKAMTAVAPRRAAIVGALESCPVGAWVDVDDFSRYMVATGQSFEITRDPWKLYLSDPQYGSLGYAGSHGWNILQLRYLLCFLFEVAATLGVIDVAYTSPVEARDDFRGLWGADEMEFLSRYDGLSHFRLTALGAYCLGLSEKYEPEPIRSTVRLSVLPGMQINLAGGQLAPEEALLLDTWTVQATPSSWRLERSKILAAIEKGHDVDELVAFLEARDDQPLPETVEAFLKTCARQGRAIKPIGTALLMECQDADTAALIAGHKETSGLCLLAGKRLLVVRPEHEEKFRTLVRVLGFGIRA